MPSGRYSVWVGKSRSPKLMKALYAEGLAHPGMQAHPHAQRILILGGGDGGLAREVCRYDSVSAITVVEIDQRVPDVVRDFFPATAVGLNDPRVHLVHEDAHRFLEADRTHYDVILVDADELYTKALMPSTPLAYTALLARLAEDGVLVAPWRANHCTGNLQSSEWLQQRLQTVEVYRVNAPSQAGQPWAVAWGSNTRKPTLRTMPKHLLPSSTSVATRTSRPVCPPSLSEANARSRVAQLQK